jgi:GT2 family glycosyltransferase/glycosyltransferase involved in cell wall biosynthesis
MEKKVGIVLVSYNAATAVQITLESVRLAQNQTAYTLYLVDNASNDQERNLIRKAFDTSAYQSSEWNYIQQEKNLGFSGGNNVGISCALEDPSITHVCLLNSDVIVGDYWLDRLVDAQKDVISAVTNRADSEQCVPTDYEISLNTCLTGGSAELDKSVFDQVNDFSQRWHAAWIGNIVEAEPTFFCVLLSRDAVQRIGLLDEEFFPGGFEDDDYCIRAKKLGYKSFIARNVFIHHWGSASFGNLQIDYFNERALKNRSYLEKKHAIQWRRRPEKPLISFKMDFEFYTKCLSAEVKDSYNLQLYFLSRFVENLTPQIQYFENEFTSLSNLLSASDKSLSLEQQMLFEKAKSFGDLISLWKSKNFLSLEKSKPNEIEGILDVIQFVADGVHTRVEVNFLIHSLLFGKASNALPPTAKIQHLSTFSKLIWFLKKGLPNFINMRGVVFFGGYPYPERQGDGYFQRIQLIDTIFSDIWRIYVEGTELKGRNLWVDRPQKNVLVLRISGTKLRRIFVIIMALLCVMKCRRVYFHSVLRMQDHGMGLLMKLPFIRKVIDIHGVVPEEFRYHGDFYSGRIFDRHELSAVKNCDLAIVVTNAMHKYLQQKYRDELIAEVVQYPMFPNIEPCVGERAYINGKPVVVYAGGLHKWQQVPKMIAAISATIDLCEHRFYCGQPDQVKEMIDPSIRDRVIVESKAHDELLRLYEQCHYGFILREDIVVNNVACPTKLVEYIALGIVPIIDSKKMGDFVEMGLRYITLDSFLSGALPSEEQRLKMAWVNEDIYKKLNGIQRLGKNAISGTLRSRIAIRKRITKFIKRALPNKQLNLIFETLKIPPKTHTPTDKTYDLLLQVGNFESGGLENVVLGLAQVLVRSGYVVGILILGTRGAAVEKATELGIDLIFEYESEYGYESTLKRLKPKIILSNYSVFGASKCRSLGIHFVQIIHNTYMWLHGSEKVNFEKAAEDTSTFIAVSEYAKQYSISRFGLPENKVFVIPNGIDTKKFKMSSDSHERIESRKMLGIGDDEFVFISMASVNHQKNHISTVRAFIQNYNKFEKARLLIAGPVYEPRLFDDIQDEIRKADAGHKVHYIGAISDPEKFYLASDAFVSASFFEGGPLNFLEALLCGLPSIMTRVGIAEYFSGFQGVTLIDPPINIADYSDSIANLKPKDGFINALAQAMLTVYLNPIKPVLSKGLIERLDVNSSFGVYVDVVRSLMDNKKLNRADFDKAWTNNLD